MNKVCGTILCRYLMIIPMECLVKNPVKNQENPIKNQENPIKNQENQEDYEFL